MTKFTVIGAQGFIGGHMAAHLRAQGHDVATPSRGDRISGEVGHVVYCAGVTADFRTRPYDAVEAHIMGVSDILRRTRPRSFLYLSSTRLYVRSGAGVESAPLVIRPTDPDELYNATKIAGESVCLTEAVETVRVARLSNVFGRGMHGGTRPRDEFLSAVMREAVATGRVMLRTALHSEKDYIAIEDVTRALERIALAGKHRLYNVASGQNTSHGDLLVRLAEITGCTISVASGAPAIVYPPIATARISAEFSHDEPWRPASVLDRMPDLVAAVRRETAVAARAAAL